MFGVSVNKGAQIDNLMIGVVPELSTVAMMAFASVAGLLKRNAPEKNTRTCVRVFSKTNQ